MAGGDIIIAVKPSVAHHQVGLPQRTFLEATAIDFHGSLGRVLVVTAYKLPNRELPYPDLASVFDIHQRVIMADDLLCPQALRLE